MEKQPQAVLDIEPKAFRKDLTIYMKAGNAIYTYQFVLILATSTYVQRKLSVFGQACFFGVLHAVQEVRGQVDRAQREPRS